VDLKGATMDQQKPASSAMEGRGAYNRNAKIPAGGGALALPFLERAAERVNIDGDLPIVVADYGSSQGKNSLIPMRAAIARLRNRAARERPILIYHEDRPSNDFNSLFEVLDADPDSYVKDDARLYPFDRTFVLRKRSAARLRTPRLERLCRHVDQQDPGDDS
jgi:hypothetical protein